MKIIFFILLMTFLISGTGWSQENQHPPPLPQVEDKETDTAVSTTPLTAGDEAEVEAALPDKAPSKPEDTEIQYSPAPPPATAGEILFTPATEEVLYSPLREPEIERAEFHAELTADFQVVDLDTNSSKASEYRKLTDGFFIKGFSFTYETRNQEISSRFSNIAPLTNLIDDGHGDLRYRRYGIIDIGLGIDKFPHDYSNDPDISTLRDNYDFNVRLTPGDKFAITTTLRVENMKGRRPVTFENLTGSAGTPSAITEITEPTDFTTASFAIGLEYSDDLVDMQFNNNVQVFANARSDELLWDNPWQTGAYGRAMAADDYTVHTLTFKPSVRIADNIRLINSLSYSRVINSIKLVPFTTVDGVGSTFEKDVLDPDVRSLNVSSTLATVPFHDVKLNIKYRYYAYENDTPEVEEPPAYVMLDGSVTKYLRKPRYTSSIIRSAGIDGNWYISDRLSVDAGIEDRGNPRREREVAEENIRSFFITVNSTIRDNLSGHMGYRFERKRGTYDTSYYKAVYDPLSDVNNHPLMRAFDLSGSDAHTIKGEINFLPFDFLNLSANLSATMAEHTDVLIGRRSSHAESAYMSAELTPFKNLLLYSNYIYNRTTIESRYSWTYDSTLASSYPQETNPLLSGYIIPVSETIEDRAGSYAVGFSYEPFKKISITGNISRHDFSGTSVTMPSVSSTTDTYELKISCSLSSAAYLSLLKLKGLRISAGYYSEVYKRDDYALDNFPDPVDVIVITDPQDLFLGVREPDYRLSLFSLSLAFYF